ncbi:SDR family NAD(P)-dependent oxidoreductase [Kitasatospora sp. NPDC056731]|uniref:SDR family NAD(P)-dependent oxidoreductase n=1 Tax=Kitasatospora sp. NPDC056731 TaxID=3155422 RepID=UPI003429E4AF
MAIVGVGVRLPGGITSLDGLWQALVQDRDLVGKVPPDRFDVARVLAPGGPGSARPGKTYTDDGGFLAQDVAAFDADFFGISPREASRMDPQQKLLLECAVEAFDDAGIDPAVLAGGDTAVVVGVSSHDFADLQQRRLRTVNAYSNTGMVLCNTANRLSHVFDLRGPSFSVDTACASALTAVHTACEHLRGGHSRLALACGVNVMLSPALYVGFAQASMLSPTGRCRPFAEGADGFVRAEGAGVLLLKPLVAALADGDRVHAVIAGSGVNADGRTKGLSLPSARAQADLLRRVYAQAGVEAARVVYVEAHGTGTQAGDPVECEALGEVLGAARRAGGGVLPVGSVKSNLGHLEAASGVPSLLKALLVLREGAVPATLHAEPLSGRIDFAGLGLAPVTARRSLEVREGDVVGVNSFGFGGANAHVIMAAPPKPATGSGSPAGGGAGPVRGLPVMVSARTREALVQGALAWAAHLEALEERDFYDLAATSCRRRARHEHRAVVVARDAGEAARALRGLAAGEPVDGAAVAQGARGGRIGFVFNGNGSQWAGMGSLLLAQDRTFAAEVAALDFELAPLLGWSVQEELARPDRDRWGRTEITQPALFVVQAALAAALHARGVTPGAVVGHSVGEVAAAHCAGVLDRSAACRLIAARSRAQGGTAGQGRMAALGLGEREAQTWLGRDPYQDHVVVAGVNTARDVTVAGDAQALAQLEREAQEHGTFFRDLGLDYAFHSPAMDTLRQPLKDALADLLPVEGRLPLVSTVTGTLARGSDLGAEYWWRNVRAPVRFHQAVLEMITGQGCGVLVEIGPHPALGTYLRRIAAEQDDEVAVVATLSRTGAGAAALESALARVVAAGGEVDWSVPFPRPARVVCAPGYPWQRERHFNGDPSWWLESSAEGESPRQHHPLLGARQGGPEPAWRQVLDPSALGWLPDHRIATAVVMPAAAYVDMALEAGRQVFGTPAEVTGMSIERALTLPPDPDTEIHVQTDLGEGGSLRIRSRGEAGGPWTEHVRGRLRRLLRPAPAPLDLDGLRARMPSAVSAEDHYRNCARTGLMYGPAFRTAARLHVGDGELLADYAATVATGAEHTAHPTVLDVAFQAGIQLSTAVLGHPLPFLPTGIEAVACWHPMPELGVLHVCAREVSEHRLVCDVSVAAPDGTVVMELTGCQGRRLESTTRQEAQQLTEVVRVAPLGRSRHLEMPALPRPERLWRPCEPAAPDTARHLSPPAELRARLGRVQAHFLGAAVEAMLPGRDGFTLADLTAAGAVAAPARLLPELITAATRHGVLAETAPGTWRPVGRPRPEREFAAALRDFPAAATAVQAYGVCGRRLSELLRGDLDPRDLLESAADALADRFRRDDHVVDGQHRHVQGLLDGIVAAWPRGRALRILELGAGSGTLTAQLVPRLPAHRTRYTVTDRTPDGFPAAQTRLSAYDFIEYRRLDPGEEVAAQGFTPGSFDLVIAANTLPGTPDVRTALSQAAGLLCDGGLLLAVERHDTDWLLPVLGLLDSFWAATDLDLRPRGPLISHRDWPHLLAAAGFTRPVRPAVPDGGEWSAVLAARAARPPEPDSVIPATETAAQRRRWVVCPLHTGDPAASLQPVTEAALRVLAPEAAPTVTVGDDPAHWTPHLTRARDEDTALDLVLIADTPLIAEPHHHTDLAVHGLGVLRAVATACQRAEQQPRATIWLIAAADDGPDGTPAPTPASPAAAAIWGATRTLANEHPNLTVRRIALQSPEQGAHGAHAGHAAQAGHAALLADQLAAELALPGGTEEVLLTATERFVTRVRPQPPLLDTAADGERTPYVLTLRDPGMHPRLGWHIAPEGAPEPGPDQVVVKVSAAALNYRDTMMATGRIPLTTCALRPGMPAIGLECVGTVTAVGPQVTTVAVGDRVAGGSSGCLASHALLRAAYTYRLPASMSDTEAATMPVLFITVRHSLEHLARLQPGEVLLVHGASGGVGLAALQHAGRLGAQVIATAGTPAKRELLSLLGIEHVFDSRSLDFVEHVRQATGGHGVDVVLNSLSGEAQLRSLGLLKPHGRFIELGKRDFLADSPMPQAPFLRNLSFFGVDIDPVINQPSRLGEQYIRAIHDATHSGAYRPLPHQVHPAARIGDAFDQLRHSRHIGKVVISFDQPVTAEHSPPPFAPDPDAVHLVTGGLSGFGAATARHLVRRGARRLAVIGRRGERSPEAPALLAELAALGASVTVHAADAADPAAMRRIFDTIDAAGHRLAGVVHAAMVLDDAPLTELGHDRLRAVLAPKLTAAHILDTLTRERDLDYFVLYSSISALIGNIHQTPYTAANFAMEALARRRRRAGLPALAVQWGALADTGYVHRTSRTQEMTTLGMGTLTAEEALHHLDHHLGRADTDVVTIARPDWQRLARVLPTLNLPRTRSLLPERTDPATSASLRETITAADPRTAPTLVEDAVADVLARVLQTAPERIDRTRRLDHLGLDSLMAAELSTMLANRLGCDIPAVEVTSATSITALARRLLPRIRVNTPHQPL